MLAAGFSSRMGGLKPLLPLGSGTAVERVVASLREAGVHDIVVVTGHQAETVAPLLCQTPPSTHHCAPALTTAWG